jgi:tripartite-type tricarboxylate transporter receptor subunit TctC
MAFNGPATSQHIGVELLKRVANINMIQLPYAGVAPAVNALMGEHVTSLFANYPSVAAQVSAGKLRVLAVASRVRIEPLPDVPTVAESGYTHYEEEVWFGLVAPAKTPKQTVSQPANWFGSAVLAPEVKEKLAAQEFYPVGACGVDFATYLRKQHDAYGRIIREANIRAE